MQVSKSHRYHYNFVLLVYSPSFPSFSFSPCRFPTCHRLLLPFSYFEPHPSSFFSPWFPLYKHFPSSFSVLCLTAFPYLLPDPSFFLTLTQFFFHLSLPFLLSFPFPFPNSPLPVLPWSFPISQNSPYTLIQPERPGKHLVTTQKQMLTLCSRRSCDWSGKVRRRFFSDQESSFLFFAEELWVLPHTQPAPPIRRREADRVTRRKTRATKKPKVNKNSYCT